MKQTEQDHESRMCDGCMYMHVCVMPFFVPPHMMYTCMPYNSWIHAAYTFTRTYICQDTSYRCLLQTYSHDIVIVIVISTRHDMNAFHAILAPLRIFQTAHPMTSATASLSQARHDLQALLPALASYRLPPIPAIDLNNPSEIPLSSSELPGLHKFETSVRKEIDFLDQVITPYYYASYCQSLPAGHPLEGLVSLT